MEDDDEIVPKAIAHVDVLPDSHVIVVRQVKEDIYDIHSSK